MEGNKSREEMLEELMTKLEQAMVMSADKQSQIELKETELRDETRIIMVEEEKAELENLKKDKEQFDEMTLNSMVRASEEIKQIREENEKVYNDKLIATEQKRNEIERKLKQLEIDEIKGVRNNKLTMEQVRQSAARALENVNKEMAEFQNKHFEMRKKLDTWEKLIDAWTIGDKPYEEVEKTNEEVEKPNEEVEKPNEEVEKPNEEVEKPNEEVEKPNEEVEKPNPNGQKTNPNGEYVLENNKKIFMNVTGLAQDEANAIFANKKYEQEILKIFKENNKPETLNEALSEYFKKEVNLNLDIKVSSQGISFNEENVEADDIVAKYKPEVEDYINKVNEEYNKDGNYDKNIIRAIAVKYYQKDDKGNVKLTLSGEKKLETYQKMVDKPEENKSKEHITYDLTKMYLIQKLLGKTKWKVENINNLRDVAYEADGKYAKVIPDKVTELVWKIRRGIEKIKTARISDGSNEKETIGMKIKSTAKSFREKLAKDTLSEAKDLSGVGNNEPQPKIQSKEGPEQEQ